jgi:hypothetical protein
MTAIITRSALVFHGHNPAPETAFVVCEDQGGRRVVTWADVMERRRERQQLILDHKRYVRTERIWRLSVAYFGAGLMGGWNSFVDCLDQRIWIDRDRKWFQPALMRLFPLLLPLRDISDEWHNWKLEFSRQFRRRTQNGEPVGVSFIWWDGCDSLRKA